MSKLLFVDDAVDLKDVYRFFGEQGGFDVQVCESGTDALKYLTENGADVVVMDLAMPVLDGLTVIEEIRRNEQLKNGKAVEIVILTAQRVDDTIRRVAKENNVRKIYQKPYNPDDLVRDIKGFI